MEITMQTMQDGIQAADPQYAADSKTNEPSATFKNLLQEKGQKAEKKAVSESACHNIVIVQEPDAHTEIDESKTDRQILASGLISAQPVIWLPIVPQETASQTVPLGIEAPVVSAVVPQNAENPIQAVTGMAVMPEDPTQTANAGRFLQSSAQTAGVDCALQSSVPPVAAARITVEHPEADSGGMRNFDLPAKQCDDGGKLKYTVLPNEGAPLFRGIENIPVKVSDAVPQQSVDTLSKKAPQQLASMVNTAIQSGVSKVEVALSPKNLGNLSVEITKLENGGIHVLLSATTEKAAQLLSKSSMALQEILANTTRTPVHVVVGNLEGSEAARQFLNPDESGQDQRQQQQQQQSRRQESQHDPSQGFLQQLRLGLLNLTPAVGI